MSATFWVDTGALERASRWYADLAGQWEAAGRQLAAAALHRFALAEAGQPHSAGFLSGYNESVHRLRELLGSGAEQWHRTAQELRWIAADYQAQDDEVGRRLDGH